MELPQDYCDRKRIKPGTVLRVTEVSGGLFVTPLAEPTERELKEVIAAAGSLTRRQTAEEEGTVKQVIAAYRGERQRKKG